ncbi:hypothetical protein N1851_029994 [Merluccius polli]|uniref:Uncharacterized protein n=1 Tax=Merluccius polli TaxID=89951 RepID=A0AA47M695_MERPO|nr:hypothetical protein N1851_029994 [Merluccius polli]
MERYSGLWPPLEEETEEESAPTPPSTKTHSSMGGSDIMHAFTPENTHPEPDSTTTTALDLILPGHMRSVGSIDSSPLTLGSSHLTLTPTPDRSSDLCSSSTSTTSSGCSDGSPGGPPLCMGGLGPQRGMDRGSSSSGVGVNSSSTRSDSTTTSVVTPPASPPRGRDWPGPGPPMPVFPPTALRGSKGARILRDPDGSAVDVGGGAFEGADSALSSSSSLGLLLQERSARAAREKQKMREAERAALVGEGDTRLPPIGGEQKRVRGAESRPPRVLGPLQGSSLFLHLKSLRDAPPQAGSEGSRGAGEGGARALWKAVFSGKPKDMKKGDRGVSLGGNMAAKGRKEAGRLKRATGNAVVHPLTT